MCHKDPSEKEVWGLFLYLFIYSSDTAVTPGICPRIRFHPWGHSQKLHQPKIHLAGHMLERIMSGQASASPTRCVGLWTNKSYKLPGCTKPHFSPDWHWKPLVLSMGLCCLGQEFWWAETPAGQWWKGHISSALAGSTENLRELCSWARICPASGEINKNTSLNT